MLSKPLYPNSSVQALLQVINYLQLHWAQKGVTYAMSVNNLELLK